MEYTSIVESAKNYAQKARHAGITGAAAAALFLGACASPATPRPADPEPVPRDIQIVLSANGHEHALSKSEKNLVDIINNMPVAMNAEAISSSGAIEDVTFVPYGSFDARENLDNTEHVAGSAFGGPVRTTRGGENNPYYLGDVQVTASDGSVRTAQVYGNVDTLKGQRLDLPVDMLNADDTVRRELATWISENMLRYNPNTNELERQTAQQVYQEMEDMRYQDQHVDELRSVFHDQPQRNASIKPAFFEVREDEALKVLVFAYDPNSTDPHTRSTYVSQGDPEALIYQRGDVANMMGSPEAERFYDSSVNSYLSGE